MHARIPATFEINHLSPTMKDLARSKPNSSRASNKTGAMASAPARLVRRFRRDIDFSDGDALRCELAAEVREPFHIRHREITTPTPD